MGTICTLKNLTLSYPHKMIFKDVTFTLNEGDKIGLLGLNGHGKSSLFKIMVNEAVADTTTPPFVFDKNRDFTVFLVPQELPPSKIPNESIEDYFFNFYPEWQGFHHELVHINEELNHNPKNIESLIERQSKLYELLTEAGEEKVFNLYKNYLKRFGILDSSRSLESLSGGEQRRVAIALGLSSPRKVILWDEPTNHLDLDTIEIFEEEIINSDKTLMMISHDRTLLTNVVDRILHIKSGKLNDFYGTYTAYLEFLKEEDAKRKLHLDKLSNHERQEKSWISRGAKARRTKSKKRIEDYQDLQKKIQEMRMNRDKEVSLAIKSTGRQTKILIDCENFSFGHTKVPLLKNASFKIKSGDKIALVGKSGAGKSSLISLIMGQPITSTGHLKVANELKVGYFSQKREALNPEMTPWELIGEGTDHVVSTTGDKRHVAGYLKNFLFDPEEIKRPIKTFSGGEKNRLQLAKFMKDPQDIWIFDEPTNDLDLVTLSILEEELNHFPGTLLIVSHDRTFIENTTERCFLIHNQQLEIFEGGYSQVAPFLELLRIESLIEQKNPQSANANSKKDKMSYNERKRYQIISGEIEATEVIIDKLKTEIAEFDYKEVTKEKTAKLTLMQNSLQNEESKLSKLIEEWAILEEKQN